MTRETVLQARDHAPLEEPLVGIRDELKSSVSDFVNMAHKIERRLLYLEQKEKQWQQLEKRMEEHANMIDDKIVLDVGMYSYLLCVCVCLCCLTFLVSF
jgi:hypothetical protein